MLLEQLQKRAIGFAMEDPIFKLAPLASMLISNRLLPLYIQVESTTRCNLKCKTCRRTDETKSDISLGLFKSIVEQFRNSRFISRRLDLTGLGEPLFHPNVALLVKCAKEYGFRVSLTSNFTVASRRDSLDLIKAGLDGLFASFDGASKQTFEKIRVGANFDRVVDNVKMFVKAKKELNSRTPKLMFETTISESNAHEALQIIRFAESLGVDGIYIYRQVTSGKQDYDRDSFASIDWKELPESKIVIQVSSATEPVRPCIGVIGCYITFDGKVLPCNRLIQLAPRAEYSRYQFGDLNRNSLSEIWFSDEYRQFRNRLALGKYFSICKSCPTSVC